MRSLAPRYESLIRLAEAIRSHRDQREFFQLLVEELRHVVPFDSMAQFDHAGKKINWHFSEDYEFCMRQVSHIPKEETVDWWVDQTQQPLLLQGGNDDQRFHRTVKVLNSLGLRSLCAFPLSTAHQRLGSLVFASRLADAYSPEEVRFLSLVAAQVALAMDDALAQKRLKLLLDLTNRVISKLDLRELLWEICASIRGVMQCDGVGVALSDLETGHLRLSAFDHRDGKNAVHEGDIITAEGAETLFRAFQTGQPVGAAEVDSATDPLAAAEGLKSLYHLPLISRERILGVSQPGQLRNRTPLPEATQRFWLRSPIRSLLRWRMRSLTERLPASKKSLLRR